MAAARSIRPGDSIFKGKRVTLNLLEGPVEGPITDDNKRKKLHQAGIEAMTSLLQGLHSTAVLQLLPTPTPKKLLYYF